MQAQDEGHRAVKKFPGLGDRIRLRLRELGYWKRGRADVLRFCHEQRYRPQYVYAWLKDRVPTYENLQRLAADLGTSMPWIMFGHEDGAVARRQVIEMAAGETAPVPTPTRDRGHRRMRLRPAGETGPPAPAREPSPVQIIDFRRLREVSERLVQIEADLEAVVQAFPDGYLWLDREGTILSFRAGRGFDFGLPPDRLVSRRIEEVFPGEVATRLGAALTEALNARSVISTEYALGQEGRERTYEARFVSMGDRPANDDKVLVVLRDITERKQAAESTRALVQVGHELAGTLDAAQATDRVVATVLRLFRGRRAALWQVDPASGVLLCVAAAGEGNPGEWIGMTLPLRGSLAGQVVTEGRPRWTSDVLADGDLALPEELIRRVQREGIRSGIVVPLTAAGSSTGALFVGDRVGRVFAEEEVELLWGFGDLAAVAVENARLYLEAERGRRAA
jgi:PAS domain S-box-containing protein